MKVQVLVCALLCVVAFAAASDVEEMLEVASFVETAADLGELQEIGTEHEGFPVPLSKKQRRTTLEPQYVGEPLGRKKYIVPEYAVPKAPKVGRHRKNKPRVFSSHYFSPMPKPKKGGPTCKAGDKQCRRRWKRAAARRRRATGPMQSVETLQHHLVKNKGFVNPEIVANYPGGARGDHLAAKAAKRGGKPLGLPKKTLAPAPIIKFLEISSAEATDAVDTSAEAEEQGLDEEAEFSEEELAGREQVTVLNGPEQFFEEGFQAPDWADEEVSENAEEVAMIESADEDEEESEEESEDEDSEEGEDEEESDEESEDESEEESDEESDEEADEDSEEAEEVSLIEAAATADDEDEEEDESNESQEEAVDEMEENEMVAEQIDMDASEDDADQDEEVDEDEAQEDEDDSEAQDESEQETEDNEEAVAEMFEVDTHLNDADTLLAEVDAHITADSDAEAETETEVVKGTPGSSVSAGQTWEDAQNEKLDALEQHLAAERAATPKFAAKVVAPTDLAAVDAEHQMPEFDQEESEDVAETVAPEYAF